MSETFAYAITGWDEDYEPPRKGQQTDGPLPWLKLVCRGHGLSLSDQFRRIEGRAGKKYLSAVIATQLRLLQIAGDQPRDRRGYILMSNGEPVTEDNDLSFLTGLPAGDIRRAIPILLEVGFLCKGTYDGQIKDRRGTNKGPTRDQQQPLDEDETKTELNEDKTRGRNNEDRMERGDARGEGTKTAGTSETTSDSFADTLKSVNSDRPSETAWLDSFHQAKTLEDMIGLAASFVVNLYLSDSAFSDEQRRIDRASIEGDAKKLGELFVKGPIERQRKEFIEFWRVAQEKHGAKADNPIALLRSAWRKKWRLGDKVGDKE
jgi:hypothetical protein